MTAINWFVVYPEIWLLVAACGVTLADLFVPEDGRRTTFWLTQASLAVFALMHLAYFQQGETAYGMTGMVVTDPFGHLLALCAAVAVMVSIGYARPTLAEREMAKGEFYTLSMFVLLPKTVAGWRTPGATLSEPCPRVTSNV